METNDIYKLEYRKLNGKTKSFVIYPTEWGNRADGMGFIIANTTKGVRKFLFSGIRSLTIIAKGYSTL
jgi:hypothetical protein